MVYPSKEILLFSFEGFALWRQTSAVFWIGISEMQRTRFVGNVSKFEKQ